MPIGFRIGEAGGRSFDAAARGLSAASREVRGRLLLALRRSALVLEAEMKRGLASGAPGGVALRPLALATILRRRSRSDRPLLDSGSLLGSIHAKVEADRLTAFVGVHRTVRSGAALVDLALVHEFGTRPYAIPVTPALRRFFLWLSIESGGAISPLRADSAVLRHPGVPARPFVRPALDAARARMSTELRAAISRG